MTCRRPSASFSLHRRRRGLTLAEVLVAIGVGATLSVMAYALVAQTERVTRRLDHRLGALEDADVALAAIERELDRLVPLGWPAVDFATEHFAADRLRFYSSREFAAPGEGGSGGTGTIQLVELRLRPATEAARGPRPVGTAEAAGTRDLLVIEYLNDRGESVERVETLHAFRGEVVARLRFTAENLDGTRAGGEEGGHVARPPMVRATISLAPHGTPPDSPDGGGFELSTAWRLGREAAGGGS